jgi:hypothetical protein
MRYVIAVLLLGHGIAHVPGFLVGWQLASFPELQFRTTVLANSIDVGMAGARVLGTAWLLVALLLAASAAMIALRHPAWPQLLPVAMVLSAVMCTLGLPEARIGLSVNVVMAVGFLAAKFV